MKVLIVEDDAALRRVYIRLLHNMFEDVDVKVAESVDEAIDHLRDAVVNRPVDLIICDWDLLGTRKGIDVLEWIRTHASQLERRFIFCTGNDDALHTGAPYIVLKPADVTTIRVAIATAVQPS